ncbi:MAG: hypothetical protein IJG97_02600 [Bacilli bacterium]|nr:hypothetical protein [Bacilli bacterium]
MKKKVGLLLVLMIALLIVPVGAKSSNNFIADNSIKLADSIEATTFAAGNTVSIASNIDGALFVAGNDVTLNSSQDLLFAAGNMILIEGVNTKDAFVAGSSIDVKPSIIRDLYATAQTINIDSEISRNAYLGGETVVINSKINGDAQIDAETIKIGKNAAITGTLNYPENAKITITNGAVINKTKTYKNNISTEKTMASKLLDRLYAFLGMLLIGLILMALNKKVFTKIEKINKDLSTFAKNLGIGFVFLVIVPVAAIIAMCTVIGVPLAIISLLIYGIMIYLSVIPTAYYLGNIILKDYIKNKYVLFIVSLLIIYVLKMIPGLGGLVTFISLCFGLGVYTELLKSNIKVK